VSIPPRNKAFTRFKAPTDDRLPSKTYNVLSGGLVGGEALLGVEGMGEPLTVVVADSVDAGDRVVVVEHEEDRLDVAHKILVAEGHAAAGSLATLKVPNRGYKFRLVMADRAEDGDAVIVLPDGRARRWAPARPRVPLLPPSRAEVLDSVERAEAALQWDE
jgi:hypothetical protein